MSVEIRDCQTIQKTILAKTDNLTVLKGANKQRELLAVTSQLCDLVVGGFVRVLS